MGRMIHCGIVAAALVIGAITIGGCSKSSPPPDPIAPTTMTPPAPALATGTPPAAKDLTHEVTKDEPLYASEPTAGAKPDGTIAAGTKVLVLIPGADYSQVVTDKGISAYTPTEGLKPVGK